MQKTQQLVISLHLTEACNNHCQYCYATWNNSTNTHELTYDTKHTLKPLKELFYPLMTEI